MKKRILSVTLVLAMLFAMLPTTVFAQTDEAGTNPTPEAAVTEPAEPTPTDAEPTPTDAEPTPTLSAAEAFVQAVAALDKAELLALAQAYAADPTEGGAAETAFFAAYDAVEGGEDSALTRYEALTAEEQAAVAESYALLQEIIAQVNAALGLDAAPPEVETPTVYATTDNDITLDTSYKNATIDLATIAGAKVGTADDPIVLKIPSWGMGDLITLQGTAPAYMVIENEMTIKLDGATLAPGVLSSPRPALLMGSTAAATMVNSTITNSTPGAAAFQSGSLQSLNMTNSTIQNTVAGGYAIRDTRSTNYSYSITMNGSTISSTAAGSYVYYNDTALTGNVYKDTFTLSSGANSILGNFYLAPEVGTFMETLTFVGKGTASLTLSNNAAFTNGKVALRTADSFTLAGGKLMVNSFSATGNTTVAAGVTLEIAQGGTASILNTGTAGTFTNNGTMRNGGTMTMGYMSTYSTPTIRS